MPFWLRLKFVFGSVVSIAMVALIYAEGAKPLIDMATGDLSGPFSSLANDIDYVVPLILALLLLGAVVYFLIGPVQRERSRTVGRRPPR